MFNSEPSKKKAESKRRKFLKQASVLTASACLPPFVHASDKAGTKPAIIGAGDHTYECDHHFGEIPSAIVWGETHGVAIDEAGFIYVKHRSDAKQPMDAIVIFDPAGKYVRSFGKEYHHGGHGIDIRKEGGEEFLYLSDVHNRTVTKTNLKGEHVWQKSFPEESKLYKSVKQFNPTNVAFAPDGGFYIADGYGSSYVHQYDKDAKYVRSFGGAGKDPGKLSTPHGIILDNRPGRDVSLAVADRANNRLQYFTLDGKHLGFVLEKEPSDTFPAHFDIKGNELLVPDLFARVSIYDIENKPIVHLGFDRQWTATVKSDNMAVRRDPKRWQDGKFIHPHDACFDSVGNIFVVEWVPTGRVSKLKKVS